MYLLLDGGYLPVGVNAAVRLDCCLLYGGFDGWSCSPVQMRPRDGGLVAYGVRAIRNDDAAQWLLQESGRQALSQFYYFTKTFLYSTIYEYLLLLN